MREGATGAESRGRARWMAVKPPIRAPHGRACSRTKTVSSRTFMASTIGGSMARRSRGAWSGTKAVHRQAVGDPWITNEVKGSGLAWTRRRWAFRTGAEMDLSCRRRCRDGRPHYLVINADESEPGTCKDREILRHDPHHLVEGCVARFTSRWMRIPAIIYVRGEFIRERRAPRGSGSRGLRRQRLIGQEQRSWLGLRHPSSHHGAGAYICGEETALLESPRGQEGPAAV